MLKILIAVLLVLVAAAQPAEAARRHGHHRHHHHRAAHHAAAQPRETCFLFFCSEPDDHVAGSRVRSGGANSLVGPLAAKRDEIVSACGVRTGDNDRHSLYVAGTRRVSLHKLGEAVDFMGNPRCVYSHLVGRPGGVSTDSWIGHIHVSYEPNGREWGMRFAHGRHHARRKRR